MDDEYVKEIVLTRQFNPEDSISEDMRELRIRIRELPMADGVFASTGCQLWSASIVLAQELLRRPYIVAGKKVVEVGAGCGLLGITIATLARCTLITDGDEEVVMNLSYNLKANERCWRAKEGEPPREATAKILRWEDAAARPFPPEERAEVVIASDIIAGMFGNVVAQAFLNIVAPGGFVMLNAHQDRSNSIRGFADHLLKAGFQVSESNVNCPYGAFRTYECWERTSEAPAAPAPNPPSVPQPRVEPPAKPPAVEPTSGAVPTDAVAAQGPDRAKGSEPVQVPLKATATPAEPPAPSPSAAKEKQAVEPPAPPVDSAEEKQVVVAVPPVEPSRLSFRERRALFEQRSQGQEVGQWLRVTTCSAAFLPKPVIQPAQCSSPWPPRPSASAYPSPVRPGRVQMTSFFTRGSEPASHPTTGAQATPKQTHPVWHVCGGRKHAGVFVRSRPGLDSPLIGRLVHGALVRELEQTPTRLRFVKIRGIGPETGWVTLLSKSGSPLLELVEV